MNSIRSQFRLIVLLILLIIPQICLATTVKDHDPSRLNKSINRFIWQDWKNSFPKEASLFVGSSSIYRWKTAAGFPTSQIINRGIAGAEISDLNYYFDTIVKCYQPTKVIFYCGDNDVAAGKGTAQILTDFSMFAERLQKELPHTELLFMAIKPSPLRWALWPEMLSSNHTIKTYCRVSNRCSFIDTATPLLNSAGQPDKNLFAADGIHLNRAGYKIWEAILIPLLTKKHSNK